MFLRRMQRGSISDVLEYQFGVRLPADARYRIATALEWGQTYLRVIPPSTTSSIPVT
jgi:hypothetical protein